MKAFVKRNALLLFSFFMAAGVLLTCTKSSPLFPMNDWVDVNCFFTVGKSMLQGVVPYRDLYEQKGPVLYFLYAVAALISSKDFFGVYLLEVAAYGLFLYFSGKIAMLYLGKSAMTYLIVAILAVVLPISPAFAHGGGAEELMLFMLAYGLYSVTRALHEKRRLTFWEAFWNGVFAACVLFIKFTALGFYMGLVLFIILHHLTDGFQWKALLITAGQFLVGVAAVTAAVALYFGIHGAIDDLFTVYFYNNLFLYPQEVEGTRLSLIQTCLKNTLAANSSYAPLIYLSLALFAVELRLRWRDTVMALLCFVGLVIGTYWGGRGYTYYGLILAVFAIYGLTAIARLFQIGHVSALLSQGLQGHRWLVRLVLGLFAVFMLTVGYSGSRNAYLMDYDRADLPAYRFAETVNKVENPKILNYGFLDGGFYHAAGVTPNCKFFCTLNINAPDMWAIQRQCIQNGEVDFVITRKYTLDRYSAGAKGYTLVDEATFYFEGIDFTYYLYQKNAE